MSKRYIVLFLLFFIFNSISAQSNKFPDYNKVVLRLFESFDFTGYEKPSLNFEKKREGWFVLITQKDTVDVEFKIWDSVTGKFADSLSGINQTSGIVKDLKAIHFDSWEQGHYNSCPYLGYIGWEKDVILDFGGYNGNDINQLYGIGRAYSIYADNLLSDRTRMADSSLMFKFAGSNAKFTPDQLKTYKEVKYKSIEYYQKVNSLDSLYQTLVGDISFKYQNEFMSMYLDLLMYSDREEAVKVLKKGLYDEFNYEFGYNLLMSCMPNAILFVYGDMDTFIPMYLQEVEGIRRDVTVINSGMLGLPRYVNYLIEVCHLSMSLELSDIAENKLEYTYLTPSSDYKVWNADKLFKYVKDSSNKLYYKGIEYTKVPVNIFETKTTTGILQWRFDGNYIFKNQLLIADIVTTNIRERPVCFSITCSSELFNCYVDYLSKEGLVYRFGAENPKVRERYVEINEDESYHLTFNTLKWNHVDEARRSKKSLNVNYRILLMDLADRLASERKADSAKNVLDLCLRHFNDDKLHLDEYCVTLVHAFYELDDMKNGNEIARLICYNVFHDIPAIDPSIYFVGITDPVNIRLENLRELMNEYGQAEEFLKYNSFK